MTQPCIIWPGRLDRDGYGVVSVGEHRRAHRLTYALYVGAIPPGMAVLHSCDVPSCVNPAHLRIGTPADNARDRTERKRMPRPWLAKLSDDQVAQIRAGMSARDAMAQFGIAKSAYYRARAGESYKSAPLFTPRPESRHRARMGDAAPITPADESGIGPTSCSPNGGVHG